VGNLELKDAYTEALHKLGHDLEAVAEQVLELDSCLFVCFLKFCFVVKIKVE